MKAKIRVGDSTSHGGKVLEGFEGHMIQGKAVALVGHACSCPIKNHSNVKIAEGNPNHIVNGKPVAFEGHKTTCGATLISSLPTFGSDT
jgi:uncharacterized Zn-binding protein involved in type VI secretion